MENKVYERANAEQLRRSAEAQAERLQAVVPSSADEVFDPSLGVICPDCGADMDPADDGVCGCDVDGNHADDGEDRDGNPLTNPLTGRPISDLTEQEMNQLSLLAGSRSYGTRVPEPVTPVHDASTAPKYAAARTFRSSLVEDAGETYLVLTEREVTGRWNSWPGKPRRNKWSESTVTLTLDELAKLAAKYLGKK